MLGTRETIPVFQNLLIGVKMIEIETVTKVKINRAELKAHLESIRDFTHLPTLEGWVCMQLEKRYPDLVFDDTYLDYIMLLMDGPVKNPDKFADKLHGLAVTSCEKLVKAINEYKGLRADIISVGGDIARGDKDDLYKGFHFYPDSGEPVEKQSWSDVLYGSPIDETCFHIEDENELQQILDHLPTFRLKLRSMREIVKELYYGEGHCSCAECEEKENV